MDIQFENFALDLARREFTQGGAQVELEPQVFDLLAYLVCARERVIDKDELVRHVWNGRVVSDSTIESRLSVLRRALQDDGRRQRLIRTYPRKGVRFVGEVKELAASLAPAQGLSPRPSVAVMPFDNLSGDATQDHLAEGIAADLIGLLTRSRTLFVLARNATFGFKREAGWPARAGPDGLGADYVVDGTLRSAQGRLRIGFQLTDTRHGYALLAEHYELKADDIFAVQDDIAEKIAGRIEPEIDRFTRYRIARQPPRSLQAWDHFHLGMAHLYRANPQDNLAAQALLQQALTLDPQFSQAYAFLSYARVLSMIYFDAAPTPQALDETMHLARTAVELDDQDATVRFALGRALTVNQRYDDAIAEMGAATELNPALAIAWCGLADAHVYTGALHKADALFQHAIDLSPHDPMRWAFLSYRAQAKLFARDFPRANAYATQAARMPNCHHWPLVHRLSALGHLGAHGEIGPAREQLLALKPDFTGRWTRERLFYLQDAAQLGLYLQGLSLAGVSPE